MSSTSSLTRHHVGAILAAFAVLVAASPAHAKCDPTTDPDRSDIANARATVAANCDCSVATKHGAYVSCAAQQANTVLSNKSCAGFVKKCASHSSCGRSGAVTCCLTTPKGTKCKIKKDAAHCTANQGTVGSCTSCCDACGAGCLPTTTTTLPNPCPPGCDAGCPPGQGCSWVRTGCACAPLPACGHTGNTCGGNCPPNTSEPCHLDTSNGYCTCGITACAFGCCTNGATCQSDSERCSGDCSPAGYCACLQDGVACTQGDQCCTQECDNTGHCGCLAPGAACPFPDMSDTRCCSGQCDSSGHCTCLYTGAACTGNADCCQGLCDGTGHCACLGPGAPCTPGANQCCYNMCNATSGTCCLGSGLPCTGDSDCCSETCDPAGQFCTCRPFGAACTEGTQCCTLSCEGNRCCSADRSYCTTDSDCCVGVCDLSAQQCCRPTGTSCIGPGQCCSSVCQSGTCG